MPPFPDKPHRMSVKDLLCQMQAKLQAQGAQLAEMHDLHMHSRSVIVSLQRIIFWLAKHQGPFTLPLNIRDLKADMAGIRDGDSFDIAVVPGPDGAPNHCELRFVPLDSLPPDERKEIEDRIRASRGPVQQPPVIVVPAPLKHDPSMG